LFLKNVYKLKLVKLLYRESYNLFLIKILKNKDVLVYNKRIDSTLRGNIGTEINAMLDNLEDEIYKYIMNENVEDSSQKLVITNVRHKSALEKTNEALLNIIETIDMGLPMDLMAVDIKDALDSLSEVTGEISSEDLLDHIFSNFCVGK